MTDLTEQWQKGELPEGFYFVKDGENMIAEYLDGYFYNNGEPMTSFSGGVDSVLEKVPSYEEYKNIKSILQLKETAYDFDTAHLEEENAQLKELLKECKQWFDWYHIDTGTGKEYIESWHKKGSEIHQRINQALGEDK